MFFKKAKQRDAIIARFKGDKIPIYWNTLEEEFENKPEEFKVFKKNASYLEGFGFIEEVEYLDHNNGIQLDKKGIAVRSDIKELGFEKKAITEFLRSLIGGATFIITVATFSVLVISPFDRGCNTSSETKPSSTPDVESSKPEPRTPDRDTTDSDTCSAPTQTTGLKEQE